MSVRKTSRLIWRARWPLLATHAAATVAGIALITPLIGATLQAGLRLSGQPALADAEIAMFLLTPGGIVVLLLVGSLIVTAASIEIAAMMAVLAAARTGHRKWGIAALRFVLVRAPRLLHFAAHLIVRLLVVLLPFVAAAAALAWMRLTEHDINYYLSARPPEFAQTLVLCGLILAPGVLLLLERLLSWSLALPLLLFRDLPARDAFGVSRRITEGHRIGILVRFLIWVAVAAMVGLGVTAAAGGLAHVAEAFVGESFARLLVVMTVVLVVWAVVLTVTTTLTSAALAAIGLERFDTLDPLPDTAPPDTPPLPPARMAQLGVAAAFVVVVAAGLGGLLLGSLHSNQDVEVIAHRAGAGIRPENTLAAVDHAIEAGADWIEIDVQESADGDVIVIHDSDFMKVAGNPLKVWDATREDLNAIDIGSYLDPAYASERIPTLGDVLDRARDKTKVLIELKYYGHNVALEQRVAEAIDAAQMADQIAVMSLDPAGLARMRALRPDWPAGLLAATAVGNLSRLDLDFLAVNTAIARPSLLRHAADAGRPVMVWTVNDALGMSREISKGVDGLITDYPRLANDVIAARADMNTTERALLSLADLLGLEIAPGEASE